MSSREAKIIDLDAFRRRRSEQPDKQRRADPPPLMLYPVWVWVPMWTCL